MKTKLLVASAFLLGAVLSAVVTSQVLHRWHQQQSQLLWTNALQQHLQLVSHVNRGDSHALRLDLDRRLPGLVLSVGSFGRNARTLPVLKSTHDLLLEAGREIPAELQPVLRGL